MHIISHNLEDTRMHYYEKCLKIDGHAFVREMKILL